MFRVGVRDFGPIVEGSVEVKPLTIFIGPNNSGKSYMAMLVYALLRSHQRIGAGWWQYSDVWTIPPWGVEAILSEISKDKIAQRAWIEWLQSQGSVSTKDRMLISLGTLPEAARNTINRATDTVGVGWAKSLASETQRSFGAKVSDLVRHGQPAFYFSLNQEKPSLFSIRFHSEGDEVKADRPEFNFTPETVTIGLTPPALRSILRFSKSRKEIEPHARDTSWFLSHVVSQVYSGLFTNLLLETRYLPAARGGILHSHKAVASLMMSRSPLAGIEPLDIPKLTGVVADFISILLSIEKRKRTELNAHAEFLEKEVTKGTIEIEAQKLQYPEIFYVSDAAGKLPLHRVASGVSELAPLILFLRHVIEQGDLLIIEEPEAHLHPGAQRKLAVALVRLVRAGVKLLITTHSDYLVQQLSNFVSLSQLAEEERVKRGYSKEDFVRPEEVGAYLFELDEAKGGSFIKELKVASEGIPQEEFGAVAGSLYDEAVDLRTKLSLP